jgi:multimeric flavodoxin WrbA
MWPENATSSLTTTVGSYRKGGIIDTTVSEVLNAAAERGAEVEKIHLLDKRIEFCTNCRRCTQTEGPDPGVCIHDDDMAGLIAAIEEADALVLGAPVNVGGVNALTQRFLERLVCFPGGPGESRRRSCARRESRARRRF